MCCPRHRDREVHNHSFRSLLHPCYQNCNPAQGGRSAGSGGSISDGHTWRRVSSPQRMIWEQTPDRSRPRRWRGWRTHSRSWSSHSAPRPCACPGSPAAGGESGNQSLRSGSRESLARRTPSVNEKMSGIYTRQSRHFSSSSHKRSFCTSVSFTQSPCCSKELFFFL